MPVTVGCCAIWLVTVRFAFSSVRCVHMTALALALTQTLAPTLTLTLTRTLTLTLTLHPHPPPSPSRHAPHKFSVQGCRACLGTYRRDLLSPLYSIAQHA